MPIVQTHFATFSELPLAAVTARQWLSARELEACLALRDEQRRATFLAGRIVAKRLLVSGGWISETLPTACHIESRSTSAGHAERPVAYLGERVLPVSLSIAHSHTCVLVACGDRDAVSLGVDLVPRGSVSTRAHWTFTTAERQWLAACSGQSLPGEQIWARKEAFYKACQRGEGFRPQSIEVVPGCDPEYPDFDPSELYYLQTWRVAGHVAALAAATPRPAVAERHHLAGRAA